MKILQYIGVGVAALVIVVIAAGWWIFHPEKPDPTCFARKEIVFKLGDTVLAVPRIYGPTVQAFEGKTIPRDKAGLSICQKLGDSPIEVKHIWLMTGNYPGFPLLVIDPKRKGIRLSMKESGSYQFSYKDDLIVSFRFTKDVDFPTPDIQQNKIIEDMHNWEVNAQNILNSK